MEYQGSLRGEAGRNPLLAAQYLLTRLGLPAVSSEALPAVLPEETVLVLSGEFLRPKSPLLERFLHWVAQGHHALVFLDGFRETLPPGSSTSKRGFALLDRLGVKRIARRLGQSESNGSEKAPSKEDPAFVLPIQSEAGALKSGSASGLILQVIHGKGLSLIHI